MNSKKYDEQAPTAHHLAEQGRDKLLLRLLKSPPQPRPKRERDKKPTHSRAKRANEGKPEPSA